MLFGVFPFAVYGAGEKYSSDFSDTETLNELTVRLNDGEVYVEDGVLTIVGATEYPPSSRVIFPFECEGDFSCYVDMSFNELRSDLANCGLFFGNDGKNEYKLTAHRNGEQTVFSAMYCENDEEFTVISETEITCGDELRLGVVVNGGVLYVSVDEEPILECAATYPTSGSIGVEARLLTARFDNVSVKNEKADVKKASDSYNAVIYVPKTGIVYPPVVIEADNEKNESYDINMKRQAITVYDVKVSDDVLSVFSGTNKLGTLDERLKLSNKLSVPAFSISDDESAEMLASYLFERKIKDGFVISAKDELIKTVTSRNSFIRGIIDASSVITVNVDELYKRAHETGCNTVILPQRSINVKTVKVLKSLFLTVYAMCGEKNTNGDIYTCLSSGCDGIIGDADALISYMESFSDMTHFGVPFSVSKGGDETAAHINSLTAVMMAAKGGADVIQIDVCITDDGYPVLSATDQTEYFNQNVSIYATSLSELKKLHYTDERISTETIATLSEVFRHLKNAYPEIVIYIKLSDDRTVTADAVNAAALEYGMLSRIVLLTEKASVARYTNSELQIGANLTSRVNIPLNASENEAVYCIEASHRLINSSYFANGTKFSKEFLYYALSRGITIYQENTRQISRLDMQREQDGTVTVSATRADGTVYDVTEKAEFVTVSGTPIFHAGKVSGDGVFAMRVPFSDGYVYTRSMISETEKTTEETTADITDGESDGNIIRYVVIAGSAVMVAGGLIFFGFLKKSSFKAKNE